MFHQALLLSDTIRRERASAVSPANLERRRESRLLEDSHCCTGRSLMTILQDVIDRPSATCCVAV